MDHRNDAEPPEPDLRAAATTGPPVLNSQSLFAAGREVIIEHGRDRYRLRLTSSNKLILVK